MRRQNGMTSRGKGVLHLALWLALLIITALYAYELQREMVASGWPAGVLLLHAGFACITLGGAALAIMALEQEWLTGAMSPPVRRLVYWAPRVAALVFVAALVPLGFDVFGTGQSLWEELLAFLMHQAPAAILLLATIIAWRRPLVGAVGLIAWAAWYMTHWGTFPASVYAEIAGLPFVIGVLFLLNWRYGGELPEGAGGTSAARV